MKKVQPNKPDSAPEVLCPALSPIETMHRNPWFSVVNRGGYFTMEYDCPQVVVLPVIDNSSVAMVRVFRPLIGDSPLELPAGGAQPNETPREAARRELAEETGIEICELSRFKPILPLSEMPGRIPVLLSVFQVDIEGAEFNARGVHDSEIESVVAIEYEEIAGKIISGEIYLSSPIAILGRLLLARAKPR